MFCLVRLILILLGKVKSINISNLNLTKKKSKCSQLFLNDFIFFGIVNLFYHFVLLNLLSIKSFISTSFSKLIPFKNSFIFSTFCSSIEYFKVKPK